MKQTICTTLSIFLCFTISAQYIKGSLRVGDMVPDVSIRNISNYATTTATISDFKGKLLILDFWGVHCTSCIEEMPHMEALQKEFGDKIQVLLVTRDSKKMVNDLLQKSAFVRNIHLPFVIEDTILSKLFPYNAFGLHIWIDAKGIVVQRTSGQSYSAADLHKFLKGQQINLEQRQDDKKFTPITFSLFSGNNQQINRIRYYSYISGNMPEFAGGGGGGIIDSATKKTIGLRNLNISLANLYYMAFEQAGPWQRVIWEVKDSSLFTEPNNKAGFAEWWKKHSYCYELKVPVERADQLYAFMRQDLERFFGINGKIETRKIKCLVLTRTLGANNTSYKSVVNNTPHSAFVEDALLRDSIISGDEFYMKYLPRLLKKYIHDSLAIIDETQYTEPITLIMHASYDYLSLKGELQKNGLDLVEAERELVCLVLKEDGY